MDQFQSYTPSPTSEDEVVAGRGLSLAQCPMSGLAIFALKYPSLCSSSRTLGVRGSRPPRALPAHRISEPLAEIADEEMLVISGFLLARR